MPMYFIFVMINRHLSHAVNYYLTVTSNLILNKDL